MIQVSDNFGRIFSVPAALIPCRNGLASMSSVTLVVGGPFASGL